ncbi:MAG: hypothetical protein JSV79_01550 [Armatimonadota bacterium]|nr:MAG: hypothetical protein JSV79_01550 [Armatimonadota bacterium]
MSRNISPMAAVVIIVVAIAAAVFILMRQTAAPPTTTLSAHPEANLSPEAQEARDRIMGARHARDAKRAARLQSQSEEASGLGGGQPQAAPEE